MSPVMSFSRTSPFALLNSIIPQKKSFTTNSSPSLTGCSNCIKKKNSLPPSAEREKIEREIAVTDEKIDKIVYGLYGVREEETKITEGK